jgi:hypothetical protein
MTFPQVGSGASNHHVDQQPIEDKSDLISNCKGKKMDLGKLRDIHEYRV